MTATISLFDFVGILLIVLVISIRVGKGIRGRAAWNNHTVKES